MAFLIDKPERPGDDECCGGGCCSPCVWDHYYDRIRQWEEQQKKEEQTEGANSELDQ